MTGSKADIIARLQQEILPLQGYKPMQHGSQNSLGLGMINESFPNRSFPLGAIHEFCCEGSEGLAATGGFVSGIISGLLDTGGITVWIGSSQHIFPPALHMFGLDPQCMLFVTLKQPKDILWAIQETLQCSGVKAVVAETSELSFTASRRFQLAVEETGVTGFIIREHPKILQTTASISRWTIKSLSSATTEDLPGVGFPRWQVELNKIRNGKPGRWIIEWACGQFKLVDSRDKHLYIPQKKTG